MPAWPKRTTCLQLQFRPGRVLILGYNLSSEGIIQGFLWHGTLWPARNWDGNNLLLSYTPPPKVAMLRFHTRPLLVPGLKNRKIWVRGGRQLTIRHARFDSQSSTCLKKCASNLSRTQKPLRDDCGVTGELHICGKGEQMWGHPHSFRIWTLSSVFRAVFCCHQCQFYYPCCRIAVRIKYHNYSNCKLWTVR